MPNPGGRSGSRGDTLRTRRRARRFAASPLFFLLFPKRTDAADRRERCRMAHPPQARPGALAIARWCSTFGRTYSGDPSGSRGAPYVCARPRANEREDLESMCTAYIHVCWARAVP
ncbi:hypothetical protein C8Q79DRAFT_964649 [Trametes meyenii]|nr:hypothetical protein C8Q79DRAFT_964649 [Trametes meyenii]